MNFCTHKACALKTGYGSSLYQSESQQAGKCSSVEFMLVSVDFKSIGAMPPEDGSNLKQRKIEEYSKIQHSQAVFMALDIAYFFNLS